MTTRASTLLKIKLLIHLFNSMFEWFYLNLKLHQKELFFCVQTLKFWRSIDFFVTKKGIRHKLKRGIEELTSFWCHSRIWCCFRFSCVRCHSRSSRCRGIALTIWTYNYILQAGSCGIPGFFQNPDPGILKNLIPGFPEALKRLHSQAFNPFHWP